MFSQRRRPKTENRTKPEVRGTKVEAAARRDRLKALSCAAALAGRLVMLGWVVGFSALSQVSATGADLVDRWFAAQAELTTWSAKVTQTRTLKALKDPLTAEGRIWFAAPNRFRWELGDPAQTIAVREPDALVILYPKLKRAERYPLGDAAGQWRDALTLLEAGFPRSRAELEKQFKIVALLERETDAELVLQPRSSRARKLIGEVRLAFGLEQLELRATELRFADGSQLRNDFRDQQVNPPLEDGLFSAAVPADFKLTEPLPRTAR